MPKNDLARRLQAHFNAGLDEGEMLANQFCVDSAMIALHRAFGFGPERIRRFLEELRHIHDHFYPVFDPSTKRNPECDRLREEFDTLLRECCDPAESFAPYKKRYPQIMDISYEGRRES